MATFIRSVGIFPIFVPLPFSLPFTNKKILSVINFIGQQMDVCKRALMSSKVPQDLSLLPSLLQLKNYFSGEFHRAANGRLPVGPFLKDPWELPFSLPSFNQNFFSGEFHRPSNRYLRVGPYPQRLSGPPGFWKITNYKRQPILVWSYVVLEYCSAIIK